MAGVRELEKAGEINDLSKSQERERGGKKKSLGRHLASGSLSSPTLSYVSFQWGDSAPVKPVTKC